MFVEHKILIGAYLHKASHRSPFLITQMLGRKVALIVHQPLNSVVSMMVCS